MLINTGIHAALGETGPLDFDMIQRAVDAGVSESDTLDWKGSEYLPVPDKEPGDEFAKDVAALANARGGILVLGVSENRATARAEKLTPITPTDPLERKMRAWLNTRINPMVQGVTFTPLLKPDSGTEGVLVVSVPASPDVPHMIGGKKSCGFPYRDGTQTQWMREFDLERAYRDRFDRRQSDEQALARLISDGTHWLATDDTPWLIAATRPTLPLPKFTGVPTKKEVRAIMGQAESMHDELQPAGIYAGGNAIGALGDRMLNPRVGLHRWVMTYTSNPSDPGALADGPHVELHHDGSIVMAVMTDVGREDEGKNPVYSHLLATLVGDLINLLATVNSHRDIQGSTIARIALVGGKDATYGFWVPRNIGGITTGWHQPPWSRDVRNFHPIDTVIPPLTGLDERRETALRIATDVAAQFGVPPHDFGFASL